MPEKEFLEKAPLYSKLKIESIIRYEDIPKPAVHMFCENCKSEQTFQMINRYKWDEPDYMAVQKIFETFSLYECAACGWHRAFLLHFDIINSKVMKIGQYPSWSININKELAKVLGEDEKIYKNGLICESQGYGIGAYAYYRRIIESIIDLLLDMIPDLLNAEDKETYEMVLAKTKHEINASDKIALVKDLLPPSLRPGGANPLSILHQTLSEGLHAKTDDECLELAGNVRLVLTYLVEQIAISRESNKRFTEGMKKLLGRKAAKNPK